jgi:hypothetical protein
VTIGATEAIPETEAADVEGPVPPITAAAGPVAKKAMSTRTPPAEATATVSARTATRAGTDGEGREVTGNGTATAPPAGADETTTTGATAAQSAARSVARSAAQSVARSVARSAARSVVVQSVDLNGGRSGI